MNIVIADRIDLRPEHKEELLKLGNTKIFDDTNNNPEEIIERINEAEIITANYINITPEIINSSPKLKYIICPSVGFNCVDVKYARNKGISVLNCPTFNSQAVAELAISLIFTLNRRIIEANQSLKKGDYIPKEFTGSEISGKFMVTVGFGNIGKKVLKIADGLGMKTAYVNTKTSEQEFSGLVSKADILVLCLPLNDQTQSIISKEKIDSMKSSAIIINVARGLVIDQDAFYQALVENRIKGAGIDTFPDDSTITKATPEIQKFVILKNVVATPHIGFNTNEAFERLGVELLENFKSCINNNPINVVN